MARTCSRHGAQGHGDVDALLTALVSDKLLSVPLLQVHVAVAGREPWLPAGQRRLGEAQFGRRIAFVCLHTEMEMVEQAQRFDRAGDRHLSVFDAEQMIAIGSFPALRQARRSL
jgi:hypothetical protein